MHRIQLLCNDDLFPLSSSQYENKWIWGHRMHWYICTDFIHCFYEDASQFVAWTIRKRSELSMTLHIFSQGFHGIPRYSCCGLSPITRQYMPFIAHLSLYMILLVFLNQFFGSKTIRVVHQNRDFLHAIHWSTPVSCYQAYT